MGMGFSMGQHFCTHTQPIPIPMAGNPWVYNYLHNLQHAVLVMNFACTPIISFPLPFSFLFSAYPSPYLISDLIFSFQWLTHTYDYPSNTQGILSFSIPRYSTEFLLPLAGVLFSYHCSTSYHRRLLYYIVRMYIPLFPSQVLVYTLSCLTRSPSS